MSEGLNKRCRTFWQTIASPDGAAAVHQNTRGSLMCHTTSEYRDPTFPHLSPNFHRWSKCAILALSLNESQLWAAAFSKGSEISAPFLHLVCIDDRTMSSPNLVQIGSRLLKTICRFWTPAASAGLKLQCIEIATFSSFIRTSDIPCWFDFNLI